MSLRRFLTGASLTLGLVFTTGAVSFGQQPNTIPQDNGQQRHERRGGRGQGMGKRGHGGGLRRMMKDLNLTDAQQQQMRAIFERFEASTRTQREEMRRLHESTQGEPSAEVRARFQELRSQLDQARQSQQAEILNVLTSEQRAQLDQLKRERKARFGEGRGRRMNQQNNDDNDQ
jgi:Spy/CpxP family protein refolding chaperone